MLIDTNLHKFHVNYGILRKVQPFVAYIVHVLMEISHIPIDILHNLSPPRTQMAYKLDVLHHLRD